MGRRRGFALTALGAWLAVRGALAVVGLALTALCALVAVGAAFAMRAGGGAGAAQLPTAASRAIAWSGGVVLAFGAALRAVRRDRDEGVLALARARGATPADYARGRVAGLSVLLAAAVGGATLVAGVAATCAAASTGSVAAVARSSAAALAYALAFAATVGPVSMAALAGRSRAGGYLTLLAVLVVPELAAPWTSALLPSGWHELTSIPAALEAVRAAVMLPPGAGARLARAAAGLAAVAVVSLGVVGWRASSRAQEEAAP
jgi:hypothetical protein